MRSLCLRLLFLAAPLMGVRLAAVSITQFDTPVIENFDTLSTATGSMMPSGWMFLESGTGANTTYGASSGSSSTANTYSFGATNESERALGVLRSSSLTSAFGTFVTNQTGDVITRFDIQYVGEQWRLGATGRSDRLDFAYSVDATSLSNGTWIDIDSLDFISPTTTAPTGALNGNSPTNQELLSFTLTGLNLGTGSSFWLRWSDFDAAGSDDGLAIDEFSIRAVRPSTSQQSVPDDLSMGMFTATLLGLVATARASAQRRALSENIRPA